MQRMKPHDGLHGNISASESDGRSLTVHQTNESGWPLKDNCGGFCGSFSLFGRVK